MKAEYDFQLPPDLIKKYVIRRHVELIECFSALENQDFHKIAHVAHQMKGNGTSYGFSKITDLSGELEIAAKNKNSLSIKSYLEKLILFIENETPLFE